MKRAIIKKGLKVGSYTLMKLLARGGNGEVWTAKDIDSQNVAVKILVTLGEKRYMRFEDEVSVVESNSDIEGIIPIFSHGKIDLSSTEIPYYIMPIAQSIEIALKNRTIIEKIGLLIEVAKTLKQLHGRGISHRDLKPPNLLYYRDRICISDFGLADFPEKGDLTEKWEDIGPKWTMAPEMRRNASSADGRKADIYSFAKSIWILITNQRKGFDGQYFPDTVLDIKSLSGMEFTSPLDSLLQISTDNDPDKRPSIDTVIDELLNFQKMLENYFQRNKLQWKDVQNKLFPLGLPSRSIWEDRDDIIFILNQLAPTKDLNHMFLPDGGGLDLLGAKESYEPDCIELDFGSPIILKPKRLIFESFNYEEEWNYFRLETDKLEPSGYFEKNVDREYLTEIEPFVYSDYRCWEYDDINGNPLPEGSRPIDRITCECSFVIFQNTSQYNKIGSTYDGRHNKVSAEGFRKYIKRGIKKLKEGQGTNDHSKVVKKPKIIIPTKFRSKNRLLTIQEIRLLKKLIKLEKKRFEEREKIVGNYINSDEGYCSYDSIFNLLDPDIETPNRDNLVDFLKSLNREEILLIVAVMYGGRDCSPPKWGTPLDSLVSLFNKDSKSDEELIGIILGKSPLLEYIKKGIQLYR